MLQLDQSQGKLRFIIPSSYLSLSSKLNVSSNQGRKYKEWSEVQAYFQLLNFEEDIPGVECRGENVKRNLGEELGGENRPGVTLEEDIKKEGDGKTKDSKVTSGVKRRRSTVSKVNDDGKTEPKKRGRKKKDAEEAESGADKDKVPLGAEVKTEDKPNILDQAMKEATLDEISDVVMDDSSQMVTSSKIPEGLKIVNIEQPNVKVETTPVSSGVVRGQSSSAQGITKATITPIPPSASQTPSKVVGQQPRAPAPGVRAATPRGVAGAKIRPATPQTGGNVRMMTRPSTPGQAQVRPSLQTRPRTPGQPRPMTSARPQTPVTRPGTPGQVRAMRPATPQQRPSMAMTELPTFLRPHVKFPCKVESNGGGGGSLYKAVASHLGLSGEAWLALRRYCHIKMIEWWQWYQPYYTFPLQVMSSPSQITTGNLSL